MMVRFRYFFFIFFLSFCTSLYVGSYKLPGNENNFLNEILDRKEHQRELGNDLDLNENCENDLRALDDENQIPKNDPLLERNTKKWLSVLKFDRLTNLTEKDKGQDNDTKVIFINSEDHLKIYENNDDDDDDDDEGTGIEKGRENHERETFNLISPESFLSQRLLSEEKGLERSKRQAEGEKKKCKCRRKGRRKVVRRRRRRRRMRRRRVGQGRPARRRRRRRRRGRRRGNKRRRGKRRCVCRKKGGEGEEEEEEGKGEEEGGGEEDGGEGGGEEEDPEVEEADGDEETTTTEGGGEEYVTEEGGEEDDEGDAEGEGNDYYDAEMDEDEGSDEESDEKEETEKEELDEKEIEIKPIIQVPPPPPPPPPQREVPVYVIPYPGTQGTVVTAPNTMGAPTYTTQPIPFSPYPYYSPTVLQKTRR